MSVKFVCDCCKEEFKFQSAMEQVPFKQHIIDIAEDTSEGIQLGYVDYDMNPVSDKVKHIDLCHKCYNEIMVNAYSKLLEMQKGYSE